MEITGKCKENFEEWLGSQTRNTGSDIHKWYVTWAKFHIISDSAKWGVYVDFFDSVGLLIDTEIVWGFDALNLNVYEYTIKHQEELLLLGEGYKETRPKSRTAAIERANELYNERY